MQHGKAEGKVEQKGRAEEVAVSDELRFSPRQPQAAAGPDPAPPPAAVLGRAWAEPALAGRKTIFSGKKWSGRTVLAGAGIVEYHQAQLTALVPIIPITAAS